MKSILLICLMVVLMFSASYAQNYEAIIDNADFTVNNKDVYYNQTPVDKLGRGALNTITCWAEIPGQIFKVSEDKDPVTGVFLGTAEGTVTGIVRGATGLFETLTFFMSPYDKPVMKPEYALKSADDKINSYFSANSTF